MTSVAREAGRSKNATPKVMPPSQIAEERKELKATTMVSRKNKLSLWQKEKKRLRAVKHQAAKRREVSDLKSESSSDLPPIQRMKKEDIDDLKSESPSDLPVTKEEEVDEDKSLSWEDEQAKEWLKDSPEGDQPQPLRKKRRRRKKPLEYSEPEPLEPIEYEPSEPDDLGSLNNIEPGSAGGRPREKLEVAIDSGASASALPMGWCEHYPTRPLRTGERTTYRTANGGIAHASGRKSIFGETTAGKNVGLTFTDMEVHRPLASVSQMVKKGNMVVFGHPKKGSDVYNKPRDWSTRLRSVTACTSSRCG